MSTIIIIGGGPRPQARLVSVVDINGGAHAPTYEIRDGDEICVKSEKLAYLQALLPLIQSGE